jgi:hypothetical protein
MVKNDDGCGQVVATAVLKVLQRVNVYRLGPHSTVSIGVHYLQDQDFWPTALLIRVVFIISQGVR